MSFIPGASATQLTTIIVPLIVTGHRQKLLSSIQRVFGCFSIHVCLRCFGPSRRCWGALSEGLGPLSSVPTVAVVSLSFLRVCFGQLFLLPPLTSQTQKGEVSMLWLCSGPQVLLDERRNVEAYQQGITCVAGHRRRRRAARVPTDFAVYWLSLLKQSHEWRREDGHEHLFMSLLWWVPHRSEGSRSSTRHTQPQQGTVQTWLNFKPSFGDSLNCTNLISEHGKCHRCVHGDDSEMPKCLMPAKTCRGFRRLEIFGSGCVTKMAGFYHVLSVSVVPSVSVESAMESNDMLMACFALCL